MAYMELHYFSKALEKATTAGVILPEMDHPGPFPVFYLLHGLSDDHSMWQRRTSIGRYVEQLPLIVVMPDGGRGWYCDAREGYAYETAIVRDLVGYVDRVLNTQAERAGRCIGGLSMGGYGALKLALKYPDLFCSAASHSGAVHFGHRPLSEKGEAWEKEFARILGSAPQGGENDIFALAAKIDRAKLPAMRIDCGTEDFLIQDNRALHAFLTEQSIPHEYAEFPGDHNWAYWDEHVQEAIAFHRKALGL